MNAINKFKEYFGMVPPEENVTNHGSDNEKKSLFNLNFNKRNNESIQENSGQINGALAVDLASLPSYQENQEIVSIKPVSYVDAKEIGKNFRDGSTVIIDLIGIQGSEAKRLIDFSAGLVFALNGSMDKISTKIFMLTPQGVTISPSKRREFLSS